MEKVGRGARVDLGDKDGDTALALAKRWQWSSPKQYLYRTNSFCDTNQHFHYVLYVEP